MQASDYDIIGNHTAVKQHGKGDNHHKRVAEKEAFSRKDIPRNGGENSRQYTGADNVENGVQIGRPQLVILQNDSIRLNVYVSKRKKD